MCKQMTRLNLCLNFNLTRELHKHTATLSPPGSGTLSLWREGRWLCREDREEMLTDVLSMVNRKPQLMQSLREDYTPTSEINLEGQGRV